MIAPPFGVYDNQLRWCNYLCIQSISATTTICIITKNRNICTICVHADIDCSLCYCLLSGALMIVLMMGLWDDIKDTYPAWWVKIFCILFFQITTGIT